MLMEFLEGVVERITYYSEENGYTVLRCDPISPILDSLVKMDC